VVGLRLMCSSLAIAGGRSFAFSRSSAAAAAAVRDQMVQHPLLDEPRDVFTGRLQPVHDAAARLAEPGADDAAAGRQSAAISKIRRPSAGSDGFEPAGHLLESLRPALQEDCVNARRSS